jgi:hypothetical protein
LPRCPIPRRFDDRRRSLVIEPLEYRRLLAVASFQDGVLPSPDYDGTRDAPIFGSDADVNFGDEVTLRADAEQSSTGEPAWTLIKWDLSSIPVGATVDEVSLTVNITNTTAEPGYHLFEVKTPWLESEVTWNGPTTDSTWEDPGLTNPVDAGEVILGTLPGTALGPLTISLTPEGLDLVQRWVNDPGSNHGFLLANAENDNSVRFDSREGDVQEDRPKLSIEFDFVDVEPPSAVLTFPEDNGPADQDDDPGEVRVRPRDRIEIQLSDYSLNDATVTAETVTVTEEGEPVTGVAFSFDAETDLITLTSAIAMFPAGDYLVTLNDGDPKIADTAGNQLPRTVFIVQFDGTLPTDPVARDDSYETDEDTPLVMDAQSGVLANDFDGNNPQLMVILGRSPEHGTIELGDDGSFTYTPAARFAGQDEFSYFVDAPLFDSGEATVTLTVISGTPLATDDTYETDEDTSLLIGDAGVLANDTDPQDDPLRAVLVNGPSDGTLTLDDDGSFSYAPNENFFGSDTFTYRASDGRFDSAVARVTLTVNPRNDLPTAGDDFFITGRNTTLVIHNASAPEVGDRIHESTAHGGSGGGGGSAFTPSGFLASRFFIDEAFRTTRIGGEIGGEFGAGNSKVFAAIVALTGPDDFPDSVDLSTPDVLGHALLPVPEDGLSFLNDAELTVNLTPGWYAIVYGSGRFGATGIGIAPGFFGSDTFEMLS